MKSINKYKQRYDAQSKVLRFALKTLRRVTLERDEALETCDKAQETLEVIKGKYGLGERHAMKDLQRDLKEARQEAEKWMGECRSMREPSSAFEYNLPWSSE